MKTDNVSDSTVLFPDTQEKTPKGITTEDAIIPDETDAITKTRDIATNTISNEQEVDNVSAPIERKFNDLSDLTNDMNMLSNMKKIVNKTNKTSPNRVTIFLPRIC